VRAALILGLLAGFESRAHAEATAIFALVVGVNQSPDPAVSALVYADDDAVRYHDLFVALGAETALLTRPDVNTRRVAPSSAAAALPRRQELARAVSALATAVARARAAGRKTAFYFVYAGHGDLGEGGATLALEDARLGGADLDRQVLRPIGADESHLIVDACYSYYLAFGRGPGGVARTIPGFSRGGVLLERPDVGLLLSTSSARESHEWEGFQAGVFSHEVRSGLYGAADADGDGEISYREIAAFVARANAAIHNDRYRPEMFSRPPRGGGRLIDLAGRFTRRITLADAGHYQVEDGEGNRIAELHNAPGAPVRLGHPLHPGVLYVRDVQSGREYEVPPSLAGDVSLGALSSRGAPVRARGAAHQAFSTIFSLPFDRQALADVRLVAPPAPSTTSWRKPAALAAFGVAALGGAAATALVLSSRALEREAAGANQQRAAALNLSIQTRRTQAIAVGAAAAAVGAGGLLLWLSPAPGVGVAVAF
jgi:hypothetical protein